MEIYQSEYEKYGIDSMPETAENVAEKYQISRKEQDEFAFNSQKKALKAISRDRLKMKLFLLR